MKDGLPVRIGYVLKLAGDENIICYLAIKNAP
jgi:hypothetical protein